MKWYPWLAGIGLLTTACSHPATGKLDTKTAKPHSNLVRVYEFKGKGRQPEFHRDATKKIQWVEAGTKKSSGVADSLRGGSWLYETYTGGRIGLADGSTMDLTTVTLVYGMGNDLESVEGS